MIGNRHARNQSCPMPPFYDSQREKQVMEHEDQTTVEETVRGNGCDPMRGLQFDVRPELCASVQAEIYSDSGGASYRGTSLCGMSRQDGAKRTRDYVRDDNRDHYTPSKFGVKLCQMWIDALKTDEEHWYLDGYNLYIDRVIFNPNI